MSFLVPLFLAGIAAVAVPVVLHLSRRQRRDVVVFPSLMFLERIPYQAQRRRRIQHWFLLSLRALALVLLAVAFARPFLDRSGTALAAGSGPRELVVLLDRSYSMGVGNAWERAVDAARDAVSGLGPLDRASLVVFDTGAGVLARSSADVTRLRAALDTVRPGSGGTSFGPALKVAQTILEETDLSAGEVVMISDFQANGWRSEEGVRLPAGTRVSPVMVANSFDENVAVTGVGLARERTSGRERVSVTARLVRTGGDAPRTVPVTLEVDGRSLQTVDVNVPAEGAATATFPPFTLSEPHTRGVVSVPDDAVGPDNTRRFVLSPGGTLRTVIREGAGAVQDASLYLRRALEISPEGRFQVSVRRGDGVPPSDLEGTHVVVLNQVRVDGASAQRLIDFVRAGGGVLMVGGQRTAWPASHANASPGVFGAVEDREESRGGRLGFLDYDHPVFEPFAGPRSGDFTGARFFRARAFTPSDSAQLLARFDDGSAALAERRLGRGRFMVWTSTLDAFWSDLALQPVYLPFVHRLVEYLGGRSEPRTAFTVGEVVDLADPDALEAAGMVSSEAAGLEEGRDQVALTPGGGAVELPAGEGPRYLSLAEHGFFVVRPPGTEPERPFTLAVNVDVAESATERLDPRELEARIVAPPGDDTAPRFQESAELRRRDQERRQSLWRFLLAGAFALLVTESLLSNWISRKRDGTPRAAAG